MAPVVRPTPPHVFAVLPSGCRLWAGSREAARATVIRVFQGIEANDLSERMRALAVHVDHPTPDLEIADIFAS